MEGGIRALTDNVNDLTISVRELVKASISDKKTPWGLLVSVAGTGTSIIGALAWLYLQPIETRLKMAEERIASKAVSCADVRERVTRLESSQPRRRRDAE